MGRTPQPAPSPDAAPGSRIGSMLPPGAPPVLVMPHVVRSSDTDARGRLSLMAACELLQESAARHAVGLGVGADVLAPLGLAWVLVEWRLELDALPAWRDAVAVETWPSDLSERIATRDFRLSGSDGRPFGRATSHWVIIDVARRRPARMPDVVRAIPRGSRGRALGGGLSRLEPPGSPEASLELPVRWSDLDRNGHVNNLAYVAWVVESVPREVLATSEPRELAISFRAECLGGAPVAVERARDATGSRGGREVFFHRIVERDSGKELALARTEWLVQVHH
jgi:medium-chain acyl-[acyl-carrier-protein] hydrolase